MGREEEKRKREREKKKQVQNRWLVQDSFFLQLNFHSFLYKRVAFCYRASDINQKTVIPVVTSTVTSFINRSTQSILPFPSSFFPQQHSIASVEYCRIVYTSFILGLPFVLLALSRFMINYTLGIFEQRIINSVKGLCNRRSHKMKLMIPFLSYELQYIAQCSKINLLTNDNIVNTMTRV